MKELKKQRTSGEQIILPSNSKTFVNKSCRVASGYNAGTALCVVSTEA